MNIATNDKYRVSVEANVDRKADRHLYPILTQQVAEVAFGSIESTVRDFNNRMEREGHPVASVTVTVKPVAEYAVGTIPPK